MAKKDTKGALRSQAWWDNPANPEMTALYLERFLNFGLTREELQSGRPIIGIAQTGSDLVPCNRHHLALAERVKDGVRDAGGIPFEFPVHPLQETGKRPTAALDRNLAYLGLHGDVLTVSGRTVAENVEKTLPTDRAVIRTYEAPLVERGGFLVMSGNLFDSAVMKTSVIGEDFRKRYLSSPEDYHARIDDPRLQVDERCILVIPYYSEESIGMVRRIAAEEAVRVLSGLPPRSPVNRVGAQPEASPSPG